MPPIELNTLLELVGTLDDSTDPSSASGRFRHYLQENVQQVGDVRAYVNDALAQTGEQFNKALQDLINHVGQLLEFDVTYGRYRGARGHIGFDGVWYSETGWTLVVETKTTDVYTVKTSTLLGYINALVSEKQIKNPASVLGLYVYGRFDAQTGQLEKVIDVEGRRQELRVVSVDALLNLLELKQEYDLDHQTILNLLLPAPVRVDPLVNLIFDVVSQEKREAVEAKMPRPPPEDDVEEETLVCAYYLLPAADSEDGTPVMDNLHRWLDKGLWGLGQRTGYRKSFAPGDRLCFYAARIGVVVEAVAASESFELSRRRNPSTVEVPYAVELEDVHWFDEPVELTADVRRQLSAFEGRDLSKGWAWFVQGTSKLTESDFGLFTGQIGASQRRATPRIKRRGPPSKLLSISEDYKGKTVRALVFEGKRHVVSTWKDAALCVFEMLRRRDQSEFEDAALTMVGRKRPYISRDRDALRIPQLVPNTKSLYFETNLSANYMVKLCYTLITRLGYSRDDLAFEIE
jgi:hypothetical protein